MIGFYNAGRALLRSADGFEPEDGDQRMEIVGIGSDIVECMRIGRMVEQHGEQFLTRVFTEREIQFCQSRKHAMQHFAGRWAAKEAIVKCLGTGGRRGIKRANFCRS